MKFSPTEIKNYFVARIRFALWRAEVTKKPVLSALVPCPPRNVLVIASDPGEVVGSRGDDAMLTVLIAALRERNQECRIGVVCVSEPLPSILQCDGVHAEPLWNGHGYTKFLSSLEGYDTVVMIGADVLDGHYSDSNALRQWAFSDLAARRGLRTFVLGCSLSNNISASVRRALPLLSSKLRVFARERQSKSRFDRLAASEAVLVADSAFLLQPTTTASDYSVVQAWAESQRNEGRFVCAVNVHPMLFQNYDMGCIAELNLAITEVLGRLRHRYPVSILLIAHDFREGDLGDNAALSPLYKLLAPMFGGHVLHASRPARASEIKAMLGTVDMLITGRMHLGVSALSVGVPMWGVSPQDKFIGLFEHFGLPDQRITPLQACNVAELKDFIENAFSQREQVRGQIRAALPAVKALATKNFLMLDS